MRSLTSTGSTFVPSECTKAPLTQLQPTSRSTRVSYFLWRKTNDRIQRSIHKSNPPRFAGDWCIAITNLDPNQSIEIEATLSGSNGKSAVGETLTASNVDSVNTFDMPNAVVPKPFSANVQGGKLILKLEPKSVTVVSVGQ